MTKELREALNREEAPRPVDPETNTENVLIRSELFDRLRMLLGDDGPETLDPLVDEVMREDWDGPRMAEYDE